jgi:hypothetical protein
VWSLEKNTNEIGHLLEQYQDFWSGRPFGQEKLSWEDKFPELSQFLRSWSPEDVEKFERHPHLHPRTPLLLKEIFQHGSSLTELPILYDSKFSLPPKLSYHIKERKWSQITHLLSMMNPPYSGFVDWCCGKGHLGRTLSQVFDVPLRGLDIDPALIEQAQHLSKLQKEQCFTTCDLLQRQHVPQMEGTMVALHSCGDLLDCAMNVMVEQNMEQGIFVSCCYHRIKSSYWNHKSNLCSQHKLRLTTFDLRIPSTFEYSASAKIRVRRRREMEYRVGFDLLLRDVLGNKTYQQISSVPDKWKDGSFEEFVKKLSEREGVSIEDGRDLNAYLRKGKEKLCQIRGLGSLRSLFSRLIELWIVGDRALWLQEQGRDVHVGIFAPEEVTPRNLVIIGA